MQVDPQNLVDHSNQYSVIMSEKGVQRLMSFNDVSIL
jgi:hypothetical protein